MAGTYSTTAGAVDSLACRDCPDLYTSPSGSSHQLHCFLPCLPGTAGSGGSNCTNCSEGLYETKTGSDLCTGVCQSGATSPTGSDSADDCHCNVGYSRADGSCTACAAGTYKNYAGDGACLVCPDGSTSDKASQECRILPATEEPVAEPTEPVVRLTLGLPLSKSEFTTDLQLSFRSAIASALEFEVAQVSIVSITARSGRRLLAESIAILTEVDCDGDSTRALSVATQLNPKNINSELSKVGLPAAEMIEAPAIAMPEEEPASQTSDASEDTASETTGAASQEPKKPNEIIPSPPIESNEGLQVWHFALIGVVFFSMVVASLFMTLKFLRIVREKSASSGSLPAQSADDADPIYPPIHDAPLPPADDDTRLLQGAERCAISENWSESEHVLRPVRANVPGPEASEIDSGSHTGNQTFLVNKAQDLRAAYDQTVTKLDEIATTFHEFCGEQPESTTAETQSVAQFINSVAQFINFPTGLEALETASSADQVVSPLALLFRQSRMESNKSSAALEHQTQTPSQVDFGLGPLFRPGVSLDGEIFTSEKSNPLPTASPAALNDLQQDGSVSVRKTGVKMQKIDIFRSPKPDTNIARVGVVAVMEAGSVDLTDTLPRPLVSIEAPELASPSGLSQEEITVMVNEVKVRVGAASGPVSRNEEGYEDLSISTRPRLAEINPVSGNIGFAFDAPLLGPQIQASDMYEDSESADQAGAEGDGHAFDFAGVKDTMSLQAAIKAKMQKNREKLKCINPEFE